ncbi:MAG: hypothetical protein KKA73_17025 [Chloroflexi bacterium]|nr:hypothetical protein [Chloroflexota bacterium]MBU1749391.1 hypothetical protein [Chloroflexota bacterium]
MPEITDSVVVSTTTDSLFAQADDLIASLLQGDAEYGNLVTSITKTSPGPLGLGSTFRVAVATDNPALGVELCCTEYNAPQQVTIESVPGTPIPIRIRLLFEEQPPAGTRLTTQLWYEPPPGLVGIMVQALLPPDRIADRMEQGLARLKQHLEQT